MRLVWIPLLCSFMILTACSTPGHDRIKYYPASWSSSEPLSIPYGIRLSQFEKGNLVANPSFEEKLAAKDTVQDGSRIKGWEKIGRNVSWVDHEAADFIKEEVNSGSRAVKIIRKTANELDEAEGIISDYITVIPGNYYFSYNIKLKNVTSNKYRLGTKLYDAVAIRVLFFDDDKQPIEPGLLNPVSKSLIDS